MNVIIGIIAVISPIFVPGAISLIVEKVLGVDLATVLPKYLDTAIYILLGLVLEILALYFFSKLFPTIAVTNTSYKTLCVAYLGSVLIGGGFMYLLFSSLKY